MTYVNKIEGELKRQFTVELKRQLPGFLVLQYSTAGAPDREIVGMGVTTRWEFKHATPGFDSPGNQELTCMRLEAVGHCRYVIWRESNRIKQTLVARPRAIHDRVDWNFEHVAWCTGFDMKWLVDYVKREHKRQ